MTSCMKKRVDRAREAGDTRSRERTSVAAGKSENPAGDERQLLIDQSNVIIAELDPKTGCFVYVTGAIEEQLGYTPEEFIALDGLALVHEDDREAIAKSLRDTVLGRRSATIPHRAQHRDGSWRWFEDTAREFQNGDGERRIVVVSRDVTQQHAAEKATRAPAPLSDSHLRDLPSLPRTSGGRHCPGESRTSSRWRQKSRMRRA